MWYHPEYSVDKDTGRVHNSPNGFYKNGEIWVDINAGGNGEGLILFTVSHELVHFMRDFAPDHFDSFAKFLFDNYAKEGMSIRKAVHREMISHTSLKYDEAYEEVVARLSEALLRDAHLTDKSHELYKTDKTVWEKIRDGLKDIVNRIARYYKGLSPESDLGKFGERLAKQSQEILDRFVAGVRAASENAAYMKNTADEGGVMMMSRDKNNNVVVDEIVTKQSLAETLSQIYKSDKNSKPFTFAVLQHTPQVFLDYCFEYEDRSFVMPSDKAYNAMHGETEKQHSLGVDGLTDALWNLYSPEYILLQTEGNNKGHHAAIVKSKGADTLVAVELGDYRDVDRAIAGESGYYNTIITAFNDDQTYIDNLLTNQNNYILYDKSVDKKYEVPEQVASGESPSGHAPETSTDIITDSSAKGNASDKNNLGMKQDRGDRKISEEELNEWSMRRQSVLLTIQAPDHPSDAC